MKKALLAIILMFSTAVATVQTSVASDDLNPLFEASDRDSLSTHFPAEKLSQLLISLELKGVISNEDGLYQRLI